MAKMHKARESVKKIDSDARRWSGLQIQFLMYHNNEQQTYLMNYFQKKLFKYHLQ